METIKGWQSGWFYITEPRDPEWAAAPEFRSGIPTRLTSWKESGRIWGDSEELTGLQAYIQKLVDKTLIIVPASEGGIAALDASTGKSVWTTDGPRLREPGNVGQWGGQGALPDLGLVVLADKKKMTFFDAKTGKPVSDHSVGDYADLTSSQRFVVVGGEEKSTMRSVVEK